MTSDALEMAAKAAAGFKLLECEACALKIQNELKAAGLNGQLIEIKGGSTSDFMVCFSHDRGRASITQNGRHVGVRVGDLVFDNLHPDGLAFDLWRKDFDAVGGVRITSVIDF